MNQFFRGNANACVRYGQNDRSGGLGGHRQGNRAIFRKFRGIAQQVK